MTKSTKFFTVLPFILLILVGLTGTILFFPLKTNSEKTCIFHGICDKKCCQTVPPDNGELHQRLLNRYLLPYALLWWLHLGLLIYGIYNLLHLTAKKINPQK